MTHRRVCHELLFINKHETVSVADSFIPECKERKEIHVCLPCIRVCALPRRNSGFSVLCELCGDN